MEVKAQLQVKEEADAQQRAEQQEFQQQQQQIFQEQQLMKQQQSVEIKQQQTRKQSLDLPPSFQHCSLKGRPFTPSLDLSIHNVQGIDVWAPKGLRPYGKAGAYSCTAPKAQPPTPAPIQPEPIHETQDHTQEMPQLEVLPP